MLPMVGPQKSMLHMWNPQLLQLPIFKDVVCIAPFQCRGLNQVINLVGMTKMGISAAGDESWGTNQYGPCWANVSATIDTEIPATIMNYNNFTLLSWASTVSTDAGREMLAGVWEGAQQYIRFGRSGNNFYAYFRVPTGTRSFSNATVPNNDGNMHCFIASSNHTGLDGHFDGQFVEAGGTVVGSNAGQANNFEIGAYDGRSDSWVGNISLTMLWNRGLSPEECRQVYEMGPSLTPLNEQFPIPYRSAIGAGSSSFEASWARNSNQVLL